MAYPIWILLASPASLPVPAGPWPPWMRTAITATSVQVSTANNTLRFISTSSFHSAWGLGGAWQHRPAVDESQFGLPEVERADSDANDRRLTGWRACYLRSNFRLSSSVTVQRCSSYSR